jgi:hypothetical protein
MNHTITPIEADLPTVLLKEWNDNGFVSEREVSKYHDLDPSKYHDLDPTHIRVRTLPDGYEGVYHRGELPPGTALHSAMLIVLKKS